MDKNVIVQFMRLKVDSCNIFGVMATRKYFLPHWALVSEAKIHLSYYITRTFIQMVVTKRKTSGKEEGHNGAVSLHWLIVKTTTCQTLQYLAN